MTPHPATARTRSHPSPRRTAGSERAPGGDRRVVLARSVRDARRALVLLADRLSRSGLLGRGTTRSARKSARGASMVESAIALPVLMMLAVGMFSGGAAYTRKASLATASREVSRYGATLPVSAFPTLNAWLTTVVAAAQKDASGDLDPGTPQLRICVSYVHPAGATSLDTTQTIPRTSSGDPFSTPASFEDGATNPD